MIVAGLILLAACEREATISQHAANTEPKATPSIPDEEYAVYRALLTDPDLQMNSGLGKRQFVFEDKTRFPFDECDPLEIFRQNDLRVTPDLKTTLEDFKQKNKVALPLSDHFEFHKPCLFIRHEEFQAMFDDPVRNGWKLFHQKYPGAWGVSVFSRVGFSENKQQSLVYLENHCDGLCGAGALFLLVKKDDHWKVDKELNCWVS